MENLYNQKSFSGHNMFDGNFLCAKALFLHCFNALPSIHFINQIDGEKAFACFNEQFETQIKNAILQVLKNTDVSATIKSEKIVKSSSKAIAKKFGKSFFEVKKQLAVTKPISFKTTPAKKKAKKVVKKKKK